MRRWEEGALTAGIWWWLIPPGLALISVTLSFTMCGYALDGPQPQPRAALSDNVLELNDLRVTYQTQGAASPRSAA